MAIELKVPEAGESITEVEIGEWKISEGDHVSKDQLLVDIETDKVTQELPSPVAGTITKILIPQGEPATVGDTIALLEEGDAPAASPNGQAESKPAASAEAPAASPAQASTGNEPIVMPAARRLIDEHNLDAAAIPATGPGGRLLKEDVQRFLETRAAAPAPAPAAPASPAGEERVVPMTPLRRTIAKRLVEAQQTAALLTTFNECDMSAVMALRKKYQDDFVKRHDIKLGFMSFFVKAAVDALQAFPAINAEIQGTDILYKDHYDIGVAIGGGRGLVVPVLRNADRMGFAEVEKTIAELAVRARDNKLKSEELMGGTFTITNGGIFGSMMSTPIVNPPQSGVLGMHSITPRPVAINGEVVIRPMMYLALTYDHRIVDGREAVQFLVRIKQIIEDPSRILLEA